MKQLATFVAFAALVMGCTDADETADEPILNSGQQSVLTNCSSFPPQQGADVIVPEKELVIKDLAVVEDACRTTWTATGCAAGTLGAWTFGQLMTWMSGATDPNSAQARSFMANWLAKWLVPQTVSPDPIPVAARPAVWTVMLKPWLVSSGCTVPLDTADGPTKAAAVTACTTLNLKTAPFRLLGIVNRIDLDGRDYAGNNGAPGELRFAYGAFNQAAGSPVNAAVILEYQYPNTFPPSWWAAMFHNLSSFASFDASYKSNLQNLTQQVVGPFAQPGRSNNGASIGQVRTNENAFDSRAPSLKQWEFRQFALPCASGTCNLAQVPVSQTPSLSANNTVSLTNWMVANQSTLATSRHVVPPSMLAGSALSLGGTNALVWNTTQDMSTGFFTLVNPGNAPLSYAVRHNYAFATCTGCHYQETSNQLQQFHIAPRNAGAAAAVSGFLNRTINAGNLPTDYLQVSDPNPDSFDNINGIPLYFLYNEIWRRSCEVRRVLANIQTPFTSATGH